jgi:membrane fusion protein (multidrug efflux system)
MVKRFVIALVLVVLVCGGLIGFNLFRAKMISDFFANQQMPAATISATTIEPVTWRPQIEAIGTLRAAQGVDVATQTAGVVKSIEFTANDRVEANELLVQIDDAVERADLASAQAAVARDRANLERIQTLSNRGVTSEATLEEAQTALAASESTLARIQATIDLKAIEAPFGGIIGIPRIDEGEYVQPGGVIATLQQLDTMRVDFTVPEQQLGNIAMDQPVVFGLREGEFPYSGRIIGIDPKIDPQTRMISLRAELSNPDDELRPGQFVRVRVELPELADVIALPQTSVVTSLYGDYVYVIETAEEQPAATGSVEPAEPVAQEGQAETADAGAEGEGTEAEEAPPPGVLAEPDGPQLVVKQTFVKIGRRQGNLIEVTEGLEPGQRIVTSGQNKLANNMPVVINNEVDPAKIALDGGGGAS